MREFRLPAIVAALVVIGTASSDGAEVFLPPQIATVGADVDDGPVRALTSTVKDWTLRGGNSVKLILLFEQPPRLAAAQRETQKPFVAELAGAGMDGHHATAVWFNALALPGPRDWHVPDTCDWLEPE